MSWFPAHTAEGLLELTKKLPKAELKMAAASLPPTALVSMTAEETGGGIQPTTCNLDAGEQQNFMSKNGAYKFVFYIPL